MAVEVFACEIEGRMGLDVTVSARAATVADLLSAMQAPADDPGVLKPFHRQRHAACAGCANNCCKYNCITVDLVAAVSLASKMGLDLSVFARRYLNLSSDLPYPEFKQRPCPFLRDDRCTAYAERALICRLYLCTPMTDRLEKLRAAVSFAGEAALQQRLVELGLAPLNWTAKAQQRELQRRRRRGDIVAAEWRMASEQLQLCLQHNPFSPGQGYAQVRLDACCPDSLWRQLSPA